MNIFNRTNLYLVSKNSKCWKYSKILNSIINLRCQFLPQLLPVFLD